MAPDLRQNDEGRELSPAPFPYNDPLANPEITPGVAVSKPTTSSTPGSSGSAIVKPFEIMPTTTSRAAIPERPRYSRRHRTAPAAAAICRCVAQLDLTENPA